VDTKKPLLRPHATYKVVLKTPLAKQLYGVAVGMANALSKLGLAVRHSLPPDQAKQAAALAFEILQALQVALDAEKSAAAGQDIPKVTAFPAVLQRELKFCHAHAVQVINLLVDLDKLGRTWYDQWFLGRLSQEELDQKQADWTKRFRRASQQVNNLMQRHLGGQSGQESSPARTAPPPFSCMHVNR
jgi:hypothetical protein